MKSFLSYPVVKLALGARVSRSVAKLYGVPSERRDDCYAVRTPWRRRNTYANNSAKMCVLEPLAYLDTDRLARAGNNASIAETSADNPRRELSNNK